MSKYQIIKNKFSISKNPLISIENLVRKKLINRYEEPLSFYNVKMINDIIYNERSHYVEAFKEYLIYEDINEFLKRFYPLNESKKKLSKILVFYEKYSKIYANYTTLPESKYMYKNIKRKQKMIDNMQNSDDEDNSNEEDENSSTEERIFTTHARNSINSKTHSLYFNTESKANNSNTKSDISIKNFINKISIIEENANKKKIKILSKKISSATNILNTHFQNNNNNTTTHNNKIKYYFNNNNNNSKNKNNNNNNLNKKEKLFNRNIQNLLNINLSKQQLIAILSPYTKLKILNNNNSNNNNKNNNNNNKNKINNKQSNSQHNNLRNNNSKEKNSLTDDKNKFYLGINNKFILSSTCSQSPEVVNERVFSSPSNNKKNIYKNNNNQNKNYDINNNNNNTSTKRNKTNYINFSNFSNNNNNNINNRNNNNNNNNINDNKNNNNNNINSYSQINNNKLINHNNLINKEYYNIKNYSYRSKLFTGKNENLKHINGKKFYLPNSSMNNNSTNSMKNISTTNQSNNNNNIQNSSNKKSNSSSKPKNNNINNKIINNIVNNIQEGSTQINIYTNNELLKSVHLHNASVLNCTNLTNKKSKSPGISNQKGQFNYHNNTNKSKFDLNLRKLLHKQIFENKNNNNNNNNNTSERNIVSNNFFEKYGKYFLTNKLDSKIHTTKLNKDKTRILNKNQSQKKLSTKLRADNSCNSIHSGIKNTKFETNNNNLNNSRSINIKLTNNMNSSTSINNNNNINSSIHNNNINIGNITSRALSPYQCIARNCNFNFNNINNKNNNNNNNNNNEKIKFKSLHDLSKYLVKINNGNISVISDKNIKNKISFK